MRNVFFGVVAAAFVFCVSCAKSYTVGLVFLQGVDSSPAGLGKAEIIDALKRMRKSEKAANAALVPRWVVRTVPKAVCEPQEDAQTSLDEQHVKKVKRTLSDLASRTHVVFDYTCERALVLLAPWYAQNNLTVVSPYGQELRATAPQHAKGVFSTAIALDAEQHAMARFLSERGIKHVNIVQRGFGYSHDNSVLLMNILEDFGIGCALINEPPSSDGATLIRRVIEGKNGVLMKNGSGAFVYMGTQVGAADFVRNMRKVAGYTKPIVLPSLAGGVHVTERLAAYSDEVYLVAKGALTSSASWSVFNAWFQSHYPKLVPTRAVTEAYVALEVALSKARGERAQGRVSTLFGEVYFDEENAMRGVYYVRGVKHGSEP